MRDGGSVERVDVEVGLKGVREGVIRALRFWIILSSVVARERRRKSMVVRWTRGNGLGEGCRPRSARWLKQNWGVKVGVVAGC